MKTIYNIGINLFSFFLPIIARFSPKLKLFYLAQKQLPDQVNKIKLLKTQKPNESLVWFHCASLGEFEQGKPLIEAYRNEFPKRILLLTFFSPSGFEIKKNYDKVDLVTYLPLDTPQNAKEWVELIQPEIAIFVKYEVWPNFIAELKKNQAKIIGISVILRPNQIYFKWYGNYFKKALHSFDFLFIQNLLTSQLLEAISYSYYTMVGDTRFDTVVSNLNKIQPVEAIHNFCKDKEIMVVGSAWREDMDLLIPYINQSSQAYFIIAPHEINNVEIEKWRNAITIKSAVLSKLDLSELPKVIFIDKIGILFSLYQYASLAFVGGGFGKGLHNTLEAAVYKLPILFGNKSFSKFQEAISLIDLKVGWPIDNSEELKTKISQIKNNKDLRKQIAINAQKFIEENKGATTKIMDFLRVL
jgi:3-deoxy-D-manno-octulosonic-acid transferase